MSKVFGIDISVWQKGYPYKQATKDGVKFAIIRAGASRKKDSQFETHYKNAKKQGWGVGAYWYTYATTVAEAKIEVKQFLKAIKGKKFEYPIYLDMEDREVYDYTNKATRNAIVKTFAESIENAGYYFGVYTNVDWYRNKISGSTLNKKYDWWIACWSNSKPTGIDYGMWQFGGETNYIRTNKIGNVTTDQDYAFKDYPSIMKELGKNGYKQAYTKGDYITLYNMNIRAGAGKGYRKKLVKEMTPSGKKHATKTDPNANAMYKKGTKFTVKKVVKNGKTYWGETPSGWICLKGALKTYCKKI